MSLWRGLPVPPFVLGLDQIDPTQQQRKLFVTQDNLPLRIAGLRPVKRPFSNLLAQTHEWSS